MNTFLFTLRRKVAQKAISDMWRSPFKRLALRQRNCAEITLPSYVNRSTVRYGFRACVKAVCVPQRYLMNVFLFFAWLGLSKSCSYNAGKWLSGTSKSRVVDFKSCCLKFCIFLYAKRQFKVLFFVLHNNQLTENLLKVSFKEMLAVMGEILRVLDPKRYSKIKSCANVTKQSRGSRAIVTAYIVRELGTTTNSKMALSYGFLQFCWIWRFVAVVSERKWSQVKANSS